MREDKRAYDELRPVVITPQVNKYAEGSALVRAGDTHVLCTATIDDKVPPFLRGTGRGWVTAEYSMLPRSTATRTPREVSKGRPGGRTMEIQRLIGRALRAVVDLSAIGERTIIVDCDVLQADGGTRTASVTGGFVALVLAAEKLMQRKAGGAFPVTDFLAATSVGMVDGSLMLDLTFAEDSRAAVDLNVAATGSGAFVEIQGTGEGATFTYEQLMSMLALAHHGIRRLIEAERAVLGPLAARIEARRREIAAWRVAEVPGAAGKTNIGSIAEGNEE
ncbi:MAG: ribonuclease PH [Hydrogenibacillus sp.]|nr:ribonuclease PH [Hydrogenibacillus sp.]